MDSRSSPQSPTRDWYVWINPGPDGGPPNKLVEPLRRSAWEWDAATARDYYHAFLTEQPDLNWRNPQVGAAVADVSAILAGSRS